MKNRVLTTCLSVLLLICVPRALWSAEQSPFGAPGTLGPAGVLTLYGQKEKPDDKPGFFASLFGGLFDGQPKVDEHYLDAREFKLRIRELVDQLLTVMPVAGLDGYIALPTSFVNQDNFEDTSSFGRYIAEQLFYEFNQRGFPIREYHYTGAIDVRPEGDFVLTRDIGILSGKDRNTVVIAGTYFHEKNATFVNARMIRGSDGLVLRTGHLIIQNNSLIEHFFIRSGAAHRLPTGTMSISHYNTLKNPPAPPAPPPLPPATAVDRGLDIH